jgi:hypothetical protein
MASTFSPTLRLELIGDGDQSGIWGQTTNNNLGALVEQAITGVITIAMVDANYTLANFNGVVDEARNQVLVLTGALSAQRNLIAPLVEKTYIVRNTTTGGFGVQIIGSSGTGVIIPNGTTASVFCDGTNFFPATTGSLGNQVINGNLAVTGTTTLTGALTASTAVFSGAISSVNPSFTGTPTAPTAISGTNTTQIATTAFVQNVAGALGTMSTQNANNVAITGGSINGTTIGASTAASIAGTTGSFSGNLASLGSVSGASGIFGAVSGTTGTFSGAMSAANLAGSAAAGAGATGIWNIAISGNAATSTTVTTTVASGATGTTQAVSTNNTSLATTAFVRSIIPAGVILMWSGSIASIPSGWLLCNGTNGTPNLQDRFIVGAGNTYAVNATGGNTSITPTGTISGSTGATALTEAQMPKHYHTLWGPAAISGFVQAPVNGAGVFNGGTPDDSANTYGSYSVGGNAASGGFGTGTSNGNTHDHTLSASFNGSSVSILPPYYALAYIMKS